MKIARTLIASITAGLLATSAFALTQPEYKAAKDTIEADYKASKEKCKALTDNAKDICVKEAKGQEDVAKAELEAQYKPSTKAAYKARVARADADYAIAKEKCDDLSGNAKDVCVKDAKAAIAWVRENAGRHGIDPNKIAASGGSAGGHLAACTGTISGFGSDERPNAMILFNPACTLAPIAGWQPLGAGAGLTVERLGVEAQVISPAG